MKIDIPKGMTLIQSEQAICLKGTADQIESFANQLRTLSQLPPGGSLKLEKYELIVGSTPSELSKFYKRICIPADAWNIMASKFIEVSYGHEKSPFYFNECGYLWPPLELDLGVELIGKPKED